MAKNDRLPKDQVERRVFAKFAEVCPIQIRSESIRSRAEPEPDILCTINSGETIAFEMVRCDDKGGPRTISRGMSLETAFRDFLSTFTRREELLLHLEGSDILPYYQDGVTERQITESFHLLCEFLLASDVTKRDLNPFHPTPHPKLQKLVRSISLGLPRPKEPTLHYYPANWIPPAEDLILNALEKKRQKQYHSESPVELLVWFGITPEFVQEQTWERLQNEAPPVLEEVGFRRLWVYSWVNQQILWVYPASPR